MENQNKNIFELVQLSNYQRQEPKELSGRNYVLNGDKNAK